MERKSSLARWSMACCCLLIGLLSAPALAWNSTGHEAVDLLAYAELTPAARARVDAILKQHPRYAEDLLAEKPSPDRYADDAGRLEAARRAFMAAGAWPDTLRAASHPMHARFHHPRWHYIDIPFVLDGSATRPTTAESSTTPAVDAPAEPRNAVEALNHCLSQLKDPATAPAERAIALCWVLHLVGDLHQPLHACELVSPQFPDGDRGGNAFIVLTFPGRRDSRENLHWVWDSMLGDYHSPLLIGYLVAGIRANPDWSRQAMKKELAEKRVAQWAAESQAVAIDSVYLHGQLQGASADALKKDHSLAIPTLPAGYLAHGEEVAARQAALAGHRLADLLNGLWGE
jgi:hypothetical protein